MQIQYIQVCDRNEVIAELHEDGGRKLWRIPLQHGKYEPIEDAAEIAQLYRVIQDPDFTGYMVFRCVEYEDVVVCVIL
jgi:hypothetical protein